MGRGADGDSSFSPFDDDMTPEQQENMSILRSSARRRQHLREKRDLMAAVARGEIAAPAKTTKGGRSFLFSRDYEDDEDIGKFPTEKEWYLIQKAEGRFLPRGRKPRRVFGQENDVDSDDEDGRFEDDSDGDVEDGEEEDEFDKLPATLLSGLDDIAFFDEMTQEGYIDVEEYNGDEDDEDDEEEGEEGEEKEGDAKEEKLLANGDDAAGGGDAGSNSAAGGAAAAAAVEGEQKESEGGVGATKLAKKKKRGGDDDDDEEFLRQMGMGGGGDQEGGRGGSWEFDDELAEGEEEEEEDPMDIFLLDTLMNGMKSPDGVYTQYIDRRKYGHGGLATSSRLPQPRSMAQLQAYWQPPALMNASKGSPGADLAEQAWGVSKLMFICYYCCF